MRIVIFGLGSIGRRHARILSEGFDCQVIAFRSGIKNQGNDLGIKEIYSWQELEALKPEIAFITNPTFLHIQTALECVKRGMHLFIEKPLADTTRDIDELKKICARSKLTCYTAYGLRFHPVIKKIKELIKKREVLHGRIVCSSYYPDWRKGIDHKKSYSALVSQGGGAILDLSHELDYAQYILGKIDKIDGIAGRLSNVTIDAEDFADMLLTLDTTVRVNLHLDMISRFNERRIVVACKDGYIYGDLLAGTVQYFCGGKKKIFRLSVNRNACLREQTEYFLNNIGNHKIMNNLEESAQLLSKILEFKNASGKNFAYNRRKGRL